MAKNKEGTVKFWFCHEFSSLQYTCCAQTIDNTVDGRYVDAVVALTENTMMGSSVLPSSLLSLLFPLHHALEDEWQRQACEDDVRNGQQRT